MSRAAADVAPGRGSLPQLEALHRRMEETAAQSDWPSLELLMAERDALLSCFTGTARLAAVEAAKTSTDRILKLAHDARLEVAGKLSRLQRGRRATDVYRANR